MVLSVELTRGDAVQAVTPDHATQLGSSGANITVPISTAANSSDAPRGGIAIVTIPSGSTGRVRVGDTVTALATDQEYPGGQPYLFPILEGERVSIFGDASGFTATASMAR